MYNSFVLVSGLPGGPELLVVLFVVVLLFGANRIPRLARASGQAIGEFTRGRDEVESEFYGAVDPEDEERGRSRS